jgi:hypothetical protein
MGVNNNISIFMLFECVQVNTGLGFHWICNSGNKGGICELMMLSILNHFSLFDLLVVFDWWTHINRDVTLPFWVIVRSGRWNVMNHIPTRGDHIWSSGCGECFQHESYYDESVIMTIYEFQIFCDVRSGGVMPLYGKRAGSTHIWGRHNATGF